MRVKSTQLSDVVYIIIYVGCLVEGGSPDEVVWLNLHEGCDHVRLDFHDDAEVVEVTVVGRREYRHEVTVGKELVPILLDLMGAAYQIDVVLLIEVFDDNFAEGVGDTTVIFAPVDHVLLGIGWVGPQEVAEKPAIWHVRRSQNLIDLMELVQLG